jgi:lipoprotein NlpD
LDDSKLAARSEALPSGGRFPSLAPVFALILFCIFIAGCGTSSTHTRTSRSQAVMPEIVNIKVASPDARLHTVRKGETLWRISKMYNVDIDDLVKANSLDDKSAVETGQILTIPRSASVTIPVNSICLAPVANNAVPTCRPMPEKTNLYTRDTFIWPLKGRVIAQFGSKVDQARNKGIDIQAFEGKDVRASRRGTVVFCDDQLKGFGKTVILDHGDNYQTVYAYNSEILVRVGDTVQQNAVIAKVGNTGRAKEPCLHFEVRRNGEPRDPMYYLPR